MTMTVVEHFQKALEPVVEQLVENGISKKEIAYGLASFGIGMLDGAGVPAREIDLFLKSYVDRIILRRPRA